MPGGNCTSNSLPGPELPPKWPPVAPDSGRFDETVSDDYTTKNPAFPRDSGLYWISLDGNLVEAAGIEPASVNPPRTGDYMLSLSLI